MLGSQTQGGRMEGADESTELFRLNASEKASNDEINVHSLAL